MTFQRPSGNWDFENFPETIGELQGSFRHDVLILKLQRLPEGIPEDCLEWPLLLRLERPLLLRLLELGIFCRLRGSSSEFAWAASRRYRNQVGIQLRVRHVWLAVLLCGHGWVATGRFSKETWPLALLDFDST